jgi:hypothetical protein
MNIYTYLKSRLSRFLAIVLAALALSGSVPSGLRAETTGGIGKDFAAGVGVFSIHAALALINISFRQDRDAQGRAIPRSIPKKIGLGVNVIAQTALLGYELSTLWTECGESTRAGGNALAWTAGYVLVWGAGLGCAMD